MQSGEKKLWFNFSNLNVRLGKSFGMSAYETIHAEMEMTGPSDEVKNIIIEEELGINKELEIKETTAHEEEDVDETIIKEITISPAQVVEEPKDSQIQEQKEKKEDEQPSAAKLLAERLRRNAKNAKPERKISFSFDISEDKEDKSGLKIIIPQAQKRNLLRVKMLEEHSNRIREDINEEPNQEIQDEEYEIEEEEEEDKLEEIQRTDIAQTVIEELKKDGKDPEQISEEELEHRLYERVVEMRLSEDLEEIKKIIRIITGQWRSGRLRFETSEGLEKAFEGNEAERKELETKRMMRKQRRHNKEQERSRKLTAESISQIIEKAMWIKAGNEENASASDIIRGQMAMMSDRDPRKEIMERLELNAFVQEQRLKDALKERRKSSNQQMKKIDKSQSSGEIGIHGIKIKSSQIAKSQGSYSFAVQEKSHSSREAKPVKKSSDKKKRDYDKKLAAFLNKLKD